MIIDWVGKAGTGGMRQFEQDRQNAKAGPDCYLNLA